MANTTAAVGLTPQQWDDQFFVEYVKQSIFKPYMGMDESSVIQVKQDLEKKNGDSVTFALVHKLVGGGVTGSATLEGNEERLDTRSQRVIVDQIRNGVIVPMLEEQYSAINLRNAGRSVLKTWIMERTRDDIIQAMMSINGKLYAAATEAQKDAWIADNADRVLFGSSVGNNSGNDHSASLANIDNTADKLTASAVSLLKRRAKLCSPKIRPIRVEDDKEYFVLFANSLAFRDLKNDTAITQAQREALERGPKNTIFTGGDLYWDGVVIKELEDIPSLGAVGAGGIGVAPVFLCGAQAVGVAWAQKTKSAEDTRDYGDKRGIAIGEVRGIEKLRFGTGAGDTDSPKDSGIVTGYFAAVADA